MSEPELWLELDAALISLDFLLARLPGSSKAQHAILDAKIKVVQAKLHEILTVLDVQISS
jgi:hypothetical protein